MSSPIAGPSGSLDGRQRILNLTIKDKDSLYAAFMPFIKNGGLFIPTTKAYALGDEIFLLLQLMDEQDRIPIAGKVVWLTPRGAESNRPVGVGIQFSTQDKGATQRMIEGYLVGMLNSARSTNTM